MNWSESPPNWDTPIGEKIERFLRAVAERFPDYTDGEDWHELVRALAPTRP